MEFLSHCIETVQKDKQLRSVATASCFGFVPMDIRKKMVVLALIYLKAVRKRRDARIFPLFQEVALVPGREKVVKEGVSRGRQTRKVVGGGGGGRLAGK